MPDRFSPERWGAVSPHLDRALELSGEQRAAWLDSLRTRDTTLAADVEALLEQHAALEEQGFLEGAPPLPSPPVSLAGQAIGAYTLRALIGQGGMGSVWLAERSDGRFEGTAAVKLLNASLVGHEGEARFRREASILARLRHPHIAHLVDAGLSPSGQPYLVLEPVDGEPIDRYCDSRRLRLHARIRVFLDVLAAVAHAHTHLIVHRDLKPSNILVTRDGQVKLLDFGIAKLLEPEAGAREALTREGHSVLTPEYAAPEQLTAGPITTETDVYALGVLLYGLLTGHHPAGAHAASPADLMKAILEAEPRRPSDAAAASRSLGGPATAETAAQRGTTPKRLKRLLQGDLDNIVAKALKKRPSERYASAEALADDLRRYLAHEPVNARADALSYRMVKLVRRHRTAVALATLALLALAAGLVGTVSQARRARAQAARADSMRDFMFDAFAEAEPSVPRAGPASVIDVVERAIATARTDHAVDPRARIELLVRLAEVMETQGRLPRAQVLMTSTLEQARAELGAGDPLTLEAESALVWNTVARGELAEARQRADDLLERLPAEPIALRVIALRHSATIATKLRDRPRALREARLAVELSRRSGDSDLLDGSLANLGNALLTLDALPEAVRTYEERLTLNRRRYGGEHTTVAAIEGGLSRAYRRSGDLDRAQAHARAAVAIDRKVYSGDHWRTARHLNALAMVLHELRDYDEALITETEGLRIRRATLGDDHPDTLTSLNNVGMLHARREDHAAAVPLLREALDRTIARFGAEHWETAISRANLGYALAANGRRREGEDELDHAIATATRLADPDPDLVATCLEKRTRLALDRGDPATALPLVARMGAAVATLPSAGVYWTGRVDALRGEALLALGRKQEAAAVLETAARAVAALPKPDVVLVVEIPLLRAAAAKAEGDLERSRALANEGRLRLAGLPHPPGRLVRLAASLPV